MSFSLVSKAFQSLAVSLGLANAAAKAYHVGTGNTPESYVPFGQDRPTDIAMNLAGAYATDGAANILAAFRNNGEVTEQGYMKALHDIATGNLTAAEKYATRVLANVAWRAGQPFRGLNRLERPPMVQFNELPEKERVKDDAQVAAAAAELLKIVEG